MAVEQIVLELILATAKAPVAGAIALLRTVLEDLERRLEDRVPRDATKKQVGHAPRETEDEFYVDEDLFDASQSSRAVYDAIVPGRHAESKVIRLAAGAESHHWEDAEVTDGKSQVDSQVSSARSPEGGIRKGARTAQVQRPQSVVLVGAAPFVR